MSGRTGKFGKQEWEKAKYKTGKIMFYNTTYLDQELTPNGQDVTLKLTQGFKTQTKRLQPGESWEFQPEDKPLTVTAKGQLSKAGMKNTTRDFKNPLVYENAYIWFITAKFELRMIQRTNPPPRR